MGQEKSQLEHPHGGTYLHLAVKRLNDLCYDVCIAGTPPNADTDAADQVALPDPVPYQGPIVGIVHAMSFARGKSLKACLVTPIDMPNLTTDDLRKLYHAWKNTGLTTIGLQETDQKLQPLVAIYNVANLAELKKLAESEDRSLSRWVEQQEYHTVPLSARACHNVNQPQDLPFGSLKFGGATTDDSGSQPE